MTFAPANSRSTKLLLAMAAILLVATTPAVSAQTSDAGNPVAPPPSNAVLNGRKLISSVFETNSTGVSDSCGTSGCTAVKSLLPTVNLPCPGAVGQTCTFSIHVESPNQISDVDQGLYRFLVDGVPPTPGPVANGGFYKFVESDPNSSDTQPGSAAVVAVVTNNAANQVHHATVSFGCKDITGDGCFAFAALSIARIDTFQP